jgi:hypothetical protein
MVHNIEVKHNRFSILQQKPNAWQMIIDKTLGININDTVNVVELNSLGVKTGRNRVGKVYFVGSPSFFNFEDNNEIIYITCALGIGFDRIGTSFLIS